MKTRSGNVGRERQHEDRKRRDRSESGFWGCKLSVKKALPFALVLAMVLSIAGVVVSGVDLPVPRIKPLVDCSVNPVEGNWSDPFTYQLNITCPESSRPRMVTVTLEIYQPATNTWEVKDEKNQTWIFTTTGGEPNETSFTLEPFINASYGGISSYRFLYDDEMQNMILVLGPYPGPSLPKLTKVEFPHVDFHRLSEPNATDEACYNMDTGETTAFDYNVTATSNSDIWFDISLRVHDPVENVWMVKGENMPTYFSANETASLIWREIRPFEPLNKSKIGEYIGKQSNYTFVYPGGKSDTIAGPKLVVAFKDLEMDPEVVDYGDDFTYSININACRNMSITLLYYNGIEWVPADETEPAKKYETPHKEWESLNWNCKATDSWEKVKLEWGASGK
jgi:hypothetical protein